MTTVEILKTIKTVKTMGEDRFDDETEVMCLSCYGVSTMKQFRDASTRVFSNRDVKRKYVDITDKKVWRDGNRLYMCPKCKQFVSVKHLRVVEVQ